MNPVCFLMVHLTCPEVPVLETQNIQSLIPRDDRRRFMNRERRELEFKPRVLYAPIASRPPQEAGRVGGIVGRLRQVSLDGTPTRYECKRCW